MYSYMGQGSPAVLEYQYGTERYVRDDRFLSGIGVETFNPYPQVHRQPQNDPQLHRQNIQKSGMMPMQKGQANLFPVQGKGQSYASSNLDSYITDKHSSTHNFSELESLGYLRNTNTDEDQIKMLYRMGKFQDVRVKRYVYRIFDNGLIQIISPSPFMVGRIISEQKRPKLYHSILKSIQDQYSQQYGGLGHKILNALSDRKEDKKAEKQAEKERKERLQSSKTSWMQDSEGFENWWKEPTLAYFLALPRNAQVDLYLALNEKTKTLVQAKLMMFKEDELRAYLNNPFRSVSTTPTRSSDSSSPISTSPLAKEDKGINNALLIGGSLIGVVVLYKLLSK